MTRFALTRQVCPFPKQRIKRALVRPEVINLGGERPAGRAIRYDGLTEWRGGELGAP